MLSRVGLLRSLPAFVSNLGQHAARRNVSMTVAAFGKRLFDQRVAVRHPQRGAKPALFNSLASDSNVYLLISYCSSGQFEAAKKLVASGVDPNVGDYDKRTALHLACAEGQVAIVKWLVDECKVDVNSLDRYGGTPFEDAMDSRNTDLISFMKSRGGQFSSEHQEDLQLRFIKEAGEGDVEGMQRLLDAGADPDVGDYDGRTPLHLAASEGHISAVEFLLKLKVNIVPVDRFGNTPLKDAERGRGRQFKAIAQLLGESGANISRTWALPVVSASIQSGISMVQERYADCQYSEGWVATVDQKELIATSYCLENDLLKDLSAAAAPGIGRVISVIDDKAINEAMTTLKPVFVSEMPTDFIFHDVQCAKPFKSYLIMPCVNEGKAYGVFLLFSNTITTPLDASEMHNRYTFCNNVVVCGVDGANAKPEFTKPSRKDMEGTTSQQVAVYNIVALKGVFSAQLAFAEIDYFFRMGLQASYFHRYQKLGAEVLANHIQAFIAAKQFASTTSHPENIWLQIENNPGFTPGPKEQSLHMVPVEHNKVVAIERAITRRIKQIPDNMSYSLEMFTTSKPIVAGSSKRMALYMLTTSPFANPTAFREKGDKATIWDVASESFLKEKTKEVRERYDDLISLAKAHLSPIIKRFPPYRDGTVPLMFCFRFTSYAGVTTNYMTKLTELLKQNNLFATRKFIETFSNKYIVFSLYLDPNTADEAAIDRLTKQFHLLHLTPESDLTALFISGSMSAECYSYISAVSRFIYYFINQRSEEFKVLAKTFKDDPLNLGRLRALYTGLKSESVSLARITSTILDNPDVVNALYKDFESRMLVPGAESGINNKALNALIKSQVRSGMDLQIVKAMVSFNTCVLKTNFFNTKTSAISFRLDPKFMADQDFPTSPFGVFFVMGADFQGFHVRFMDVARGGIRMIKSRDTNAYARNVSSQFAENYGLAFTQNLKNKDIPEFGSKGTILLNPGSQSEDVVAFRKYISAVLDLLVMKDNPALDHYGKEEILFMGPDEGTAPFMEWAAFYAKKKGYKYWRAFTTGKPNAMGGIPHDTYGMTTRSVHAYVVGCLKKLGLQESEVTKIQTGGPDGDLGSNEILISSDKTKAIVDGSGVLYDPAGLDRAEIARLAQNRVMVEKFDKSKLGPGGFLVLVNDNNVTLPNGELIERGVDFRNEFHLHDLATADLFVPCGGRPESVNLANVNRLFNSDGSCKFKIIVEGANLFISQDARMVLEEAGVILYKDASTNKGGVTSSSLEVLAALAMDDAQFAEHMAVRDGNIPKFYKEYVEEVQTRIEADASLEFECIWREHERTGIRRFLLTDQVSNKINQLNQFVSKSPLWDDKKLRMVVLENAIPKKLQEYVGLDNVMKNAPENYIKAIFSAYLSSRYVYKYGISANEFSFFDFMQPYVQKALLKK